MKVTSDHWLMLGVCSLKVLHEGLLMPVLLYGSETMLWRQKQWPRIRAVQMDNFKGLFGIQRIYRVLNAWIRELCGIVKGADEVFFIGLVILKKSRMIGLLKECM